MACNRELIFSTLYTRLSNLSGVAYISRVFKTFDDLEASQQPAIIMIKSTEETINQRGYPTVWKLNGLLYLYVRNDADPHLGPSVLLNQMLTSIESAFERQPNETYVSNPSFANTPNDFMTNLNGLCSHAWISGPIQTDEGTLGSQAVAVIPFEIMATS